VGPSPAAAPLPELGKKPAFLSLRKLIGWTVFDLGLALLIGTALGLGVFAIMFPYRPAQELAFCYGLHHLGVPLTTPGLRDKYERASSEWRYFQELDCRTTPASDQALVDWLRDNTDFELEEIKRGRTEWASKSTAAKLSVTLIGPEGRDRPEVPWVQLGYQPATWPPLWSAHGPFMQDGPPRASFLLLYLGCLQIGFCAVGLLRWWRNRWKASPLELPPRREGQALLVTLGVAGGLAALFWVHLQAVRYLFGPAVSQSGYLPFIPSAAWLMPLPYQSLWMTVQPPGLQLVIGVIVVLGGPLTQELFFRGGLLGMWTGANRFRTGAVLSALIPALLMLDWTIFPVLLVAGLALAWLYRWSRSLLATLIAHIVFNAAILAMVFGLIPSLPHQIDLLCGQWVEVAVVDPKNPPPNPEGSPTELRGDREVVPLELTDYTAVVPPPEIEFLRGGTIRGGRVVSKDVQLTPIRYEWVDEDVIEVRWERETIIKPMKLTTTLEFIRYKVAVDWKTLTLTRASDGMVFRYRRDGEVYRGKVASRNSP
jgi:membrane protease YdiL (CAAX protease family)